MDKESNGWWDLRLEALHKPRYDGDDVTVMRGKHKVRGWLRWLFRNYSHPPYLTHPFLSSSSSSTATANWKAMAAEISWQERERHFALVGSGKSFLSLLSNIPTQYLTSLHSHGLWHCITPPSLSFSLFFAVLYQLTTDLLLGGWIRQTNQSITNDYISPFFMITNNSKVRE